MPEEPFLVSYGLVNSVFFPIYVSFFLSSFYFPHLRSLLYVQILACARQNQQNYLCAQRRLRSAWASAVRSKDSQGPKARLICLRWAHRTFRCFLLFVFFCFFFFVFFVLFFRAAAQFSALPLCAGGEG